MKNINELLSEITVTHAGYEVKNLTYKPLDNIIVGLVRDKLFGKETLHNGFVSCVWNKQGYPQRKNKGRKDLLLNLK